VKEIESLVVGEEWVSAVLEEQVYDIIVAFFRGPEDRCCDGVTTFCVDIYALLD